MGFFDKFYKKNTKGKIRITFLNKKEVVDEQEQFLINIETDGYPKKAEPQKKTAKADKTDKAPASSVSKKAEPMKIVVVPEDKKPAPTAKAPTKTTAKANRSTIPVSEVAKAPDESGAVTVTEGKATRNGKFDIKRAKDGRYFFNLYASNYAVIAYSQIYSSSSAAMNGIKSIIANAGKTPIEDTTLKAPKSYPCPKWEIYIDKAGEYRFRLYATNGQCICHSSHGYSTKSGCKGGIESIGRFASAAAKIDKTYLK